VRQQVIKREKMHSKQVAMPLWQLQAVHCATAVTIGYQLLHVFEGGWQDVAAPARQWLAVVQGYAQLHATSKMPLYNPSLLLLTFQ
jgi:hypothetical protein